jgi:hypothetical protein
MKATAPTQVDCTFADLDALDYAHHEIGRARLMLSLAVEKDTVNDREERRMLLDAALAALDPAVAKFRRTLRTLWMRLNGVCKARARARNIRPVGHRTDNG